MSKTNTIGFRVPQRQVLREEDVVITITNKAEENKIIAAKKYGVVSIFPLHDEETGEAYFYVHISDLASKEEIMKKEEMGQEEDMKEWRVGVVGEIQYCEKIEKDENEEGYSDEDEEEEVEDYSEEEADEALRKRRVTLTVFDRKVLKQEDVVVRITNKEGKSKTVELKKYGVVSIFPLHDDETGEAYFFVYVSGLASKEEIMKKEEIGQEEDIEEWKIEVVGETEHWDEKKNVEGEEGCSGGEQDEPFIILQGNERQDGNVYEREQWEVLERSEWVSTEKCEKSLKKGVMDTEVCRDGEEREEESEYVSDSSESNSSYEEITESSDEESESDETWVEMSNQIGIEKEENEIARYCYHEGTGVEKDQDQAYQWFKKAAEQGHVQAQFNAGLHYDKGEGVERDEEKAFEWTKKAAEQGDDEFEGSTYWPPPECFVKQIVCKEGDVWAEYVAIRQQLSEVLRSIWDKDKAVAYSKAGDVWSFGVVIYEMFSGERPYHVAKENEQVIRNVLDEKNPYRLWAFYLLQQRCFLEEKQRPTFAEMAQEIEKMLAEIDEEEGSKATDSYGASSGDYSFSIRNYEKDKRKHY
eukprot:TRINITY_DN706_c1_g1_i2.p1 TRINITY_DN706_c1_g1~~TRINITY_DN706_c1_g1_i2.p1  ORF type:complete len:678 (-),score=240.77 TRINITY_DN706_c1_g1_i2:32-1783(-)